MLLSNISWILSPSLKLEGTILPPSFLVLFREGLILIDIAYLQEEDPVGSYLGLNATRWKLGVWLFGDCFGTTLLRGVLTHGLSSCWVLDLPPNIPLELVVGLWFSKFSDSSELAGVRINISEGSLSA